MNPKFQVGDTWLDGMGDVVTIVSTTAPGDQPIVGIGVIKDETYARSYSSDGQFIRGTRSSYDLLSKVEPLFEGEGWLSPTGVYSPGVLGDSAAVVAKGQGWRRIRVREVRDTDASTKREVR